MDALDSENWYENVENENAGLSQVDNPAQTRRNGGKSGKKSESFSYSGSYAEEEELQAKMCIRDRYMNMAEKIIPFFWIKKHSHCLDI